MKVIKFPSIEHFTNIVYTIKQKYEYIGKDEQENPIYDETKEKPIIKFIGHVKLHGTNAGIGYNNRDKLWCQSRENIITIHKDNAGFANFVEFNKEIIINLIKNLADFYNINLDENSIVLYGEWCGKGIQKGVAISEIEKSFFLFPYFKIAPFDISIPNYYNINYLTFDYKKIYNLCDYKTFIIEIDFNIPEKSLEQLIEMTLEVEKQCPVGESFGVKGLGEGIVFSNLNEKGELLMFKSKGELHKKTTPKVPKENIHSEINAIYSQLLDEVAENVCKPWRLEQFLTESCNLLNGGTIEKKYLGEFIKSVTKDIIKEELNYINEQGVEPKELTGRIAIICKNYFLEQEKKQNGY
jgi:hypothetical protein